MADQGKSNQDAGKLELWGIHNTNRRTERPLSINKLALEHVIVRFLDTETSGTFDSPIGSFRSVGNKYRMKHAGGL